MCHVIEGRENIEKFRLRAIFHALKLETKGLKGRFNSAKIAREILSKAGIKPAVKKVELLEQYVEYLKTVGLG